MLYVHVTHAGETLQGYTEPLNGTTISAEAGASNVTTLRCDIHRVSPEAELQQVVTLWQLENYKGQEGLTQIATVMGDHNDSIILHGDPNTASVVFDTYENKLTFLLFDSDFADTVLTCGRSGSEASLNIGRFPLVVFSKQTHTHASHVHVHVHTYVRNTCTCG